MKKELLISGLCAAFFSCSPENKHQTRELLADTTTIISQLDSAKNQPAPDGTLVQNTDKDDRKLLPGELKILLDTYYPGWALPEVTPEALDQALAKPQGPYFITGYYNPGQYKDYVVQIAEKRKIKVIAFIKSADSTQTLVVLQTDALPGPEKKATSPLALLPGRPELKPEPETKPGISQPDSFILMNNQKSTSYYFFYKNGLLTLGKTDFIN